MRDDLVQELRDWAAIVEEAAAHNVHVQVLNMNMCKDAADEIERLLAAGDRVAAALNWHHDHGQYRCEDEYALSDWEEARRG